MKGNKSTRDKILDLIKKEISLSVNELTESLHITHMAVRKHLSSLEKEGLISSREIKQPMGRPLQTYFLTEMGEQLFPKNYERITIEFLQDLNELYGEESVELLFKKREQRLTNEYTEKIKSTSVSEKVKELVDIQNEKGYMADLVQIDPTTYEIIEHNCPILAVANQYKIACSCETQLLKNVLNTDQIKRTTCKTDGDPHCKFLITFSKGE
ncbi:helix-turn-helix transcriptional regulator [Niallia sp. Krafla_26]|uniref:helix-turn-helix transcriptional regulator n=1 Tax=Niallia sp. Krafla_26 TaxID=3064703 RepID=UPI003D185D5C